MFVILMGDNKNINVTQSNVNYLGESNAEEMLFLLPKEYNGIDLKTCTITLHWINQNQEGDIITIIPDEVLYKELYYQTIIPITTLFTSLVGDIELWLEINKTEENFLLKTNTTYLKINDHKNVENYISPLQLEIIEQYIADLENFNAVSISTLNSAKTSEDNAKISEDNAKISEDNAKASETNARDSELNAKNSENNAKSSEIITTQAMTDYLAMIGVNIATLDTNGHLTASQIPPLAINDTFSVENTDKMLLLTAQRGDVALIIVNDVVSDSYILTSDDPTILSNWKKLGVSYVAEAGHSVNADTANDSNMINGHRIATFDSQNAYTNAVKDSNTFYFVKAV